MNALAHHHVGQADPRRQHPHPHLPFLRLGALFFNQPQFLGTAVVSDDDSFVSHGPPPAWPALSATKMYPAGGPLLNMKAGGRGANTPSAWNLQRLTRGRAPPPSTAGLADAGREPVGGRVGAAGPRARGGRLGGTQ